MFTVTPLSAKLHSMNQLIKVAIIAQNVHFFNHLSFDLLGSRRLSYGGSEFGYSFKMHNYFIACCTLIAQVAGSMLSRVT